MRVGELLAEHERDDEADEGKCLSEREAQEHVLADNAVRLGLTGDGLHALSEDDADADAGADGREAVAERTDGAGDFREKRHVLSFAVRPTGGPPVRGLGMMELFNYGRTGRTCRSVLGVQRTADVDRGEQGEDVGLKCLNQDLEAREGHSHRE